MVMVSKKIKLFVDAHSFDTEYQGTQTFIRELYTELLDHYPEFDVYFGAFNTRRISEAFPSLKSSHILPYKSPGILRFLLDIPSYIRKYQFDYAHFQYMAPIQKSNCRYIVTLHDILFNDFPEDFSFFYSWSRRFLFGRSIKRADIKTTVSEYSRNRIATYYNIPPLQIHVLPNGANTSLTGFYTSKQESDQVLKRKFGIENFILYVSRVEKRKNHLLLLKKYLKLKLYERNISLVFIGKTSVKIPALLTLISEMNPEQKKFFYWFQQVGQEDLASFYTSCKVFVYPSKSEGFGMPPLEAAICKVPVLCSSATAMKSYNFFEPYTFDPEDDKEFEEKLLSIINTTPSVSFIENTAMTVKKQYSWKHTGKLFYNLIRTDFRLCN
jgi:glycosyltransferase involved in cell wall biosynthesis